jgi:hypothetical protein
MAARNYALDLDDFDDFDGDADLEACLHDQERVSRTSGPYQRASRTSGPYLRLAGGTARTSSPSGPAGLESATATRSGVAPVDRASNAAPAPTIPQAPSMPEFVVGERMSLMLEEQAEAMPTAGVMAMVVMFLAMTVMGAFLYYG